MKRIFAFLTIMGFLAFGLVNNVAAQDDSTSVDTSAVAEDTGAVAQEQPAQEDLTADAAPVEEVVEEEAPEGLHQFIKRKFIDGDPVFMSFVLICLILGLAFCIERILYLSMATVNTGQFIEDVESALSSGGVEAAKEVCRNTRGPIASIYYQGFERSGEGIDMVEKAVVSYGSVQMGLLEKGMSWISLFIALAPMLGFFGTVFGMIKAFDAIAEQNNISPQIVANGIGVALITTLSGLLVAMILQVFYNLIVSKVDGLVNEMEDASISLVDMLVKHNLKNS
ncbi:MAG: MotA/TolQ/ExbB proton channel family protein [Bacteroidota bacterium]